MTIILATPRQITAQVLPQAPSIPQVQAQAQAQAIPQAQAQAFQVNKLFFSKLES